MSSPTKGGKKWDERMLSHLFLSIYETLDISFTKEDKDAIVAMMNGRFGHDVNWNGIRQHLQKLKKKDASAPSTPAKPAGAAKQKKPTGSTGKKRTHQVAADVDVDVDEDEYDKPDVKKLKVKMEPLGYDPVHLDDDDDDGEV